MKKIFTLLVIFFLSYCNVFAQSSETTLFGILDLLHKDSLKRTVQDMQDFESRFCAKTVGHNKKVAQYLVNRLISYGIEDARIDSFFVTYDGWAGYYEQYMYNVLGTLKGTGATDSTVIIGAHLDAISHSEYILSETAPGADDNATGCAVMIEMARIIHENNLKPYHNIDFMAYDAEEIGLLGARYDATKRKEANENIIVMLNNDMVGNQPEDTEYIVTLRPYANSLDVTEKAIHALNEYTTVTPVLAEQWNSPNSDSYAYFINGYKANFPIEYDFSPHYHGVYDLIEHLNFEYCRQIARLNFVLLNDYAGISLPVNVIENKKNFDEHITVFPNPAIEMIRVHNDHPIVMHRIDLYDITGRLIQSVQNIENQQNIIHLNSYTTGVYLMRIHTDKGIINKKIIKQ